MVPRMPPVMVSVAMEAFSFPDPHQVSLLPPNEQFYLEKYVFVFRHPPAAARLCFPVSAPNSVSYAVRRRNCALLSDAVGELPTSSRPYVGGIS